MMPQSSAQARATKKYHEKFDSILIRVPRGKKAIIDKHAEGNGESTTLFIRRAIDETMERDKQKTEE